MVDLLLNNVYSYLHCPPICGRCQENVKCLVYLQTSYAAPENKVQANYNKRKREMGLIIPAKYVAVTKDKRFTEILVTKLLRKKHPNFELKVIANDVS